VIRTASCPDGQLLYGESTGDSRHGGWPRTDGDQTGSPRVSSLTISHNQDRPDHEKVSDGVELKTFYQKHVPRMPPIWVRAIGVPTEEGDEAVEYAAVPCVTTNLGWSPIWGADGRFSQDGRRQRIASARPHGGRRTCWSRRESAELGAGSSRLCRRRWHAKPWLLNARASPLPPTGP
jgi:hypothetical protein